MRSLVRVVWSEGMHLAQHHFQQQSRFCEDTTGFILSSLFYRPYGLITCRMDDEALRNGTVSLLHAHGVMPDGLPFHFPDDPAPPVLNIRERLSPTQDADLVLLGIPEYRPQQPNCSLDGETGAEDVRYVSMTRSVRDEITGADEKTVQLAKKNFRLLLEAESDRQALVTLPLARVRRDQAGQFVYDGEYVPPCLHIGASPALLRLLDRLLGILESKAESLSTERLDGGGRASLADMTEREIVSFWLSHAVHSAIPPIRHLSRTPAAHPEAVYGELARLAGALCTFALDADPRDLPAYDHDAPQSCLAALDGHIRQLINVLLPPEAARMALRPSEKYFYTAAVTDRRSLGSARWFLGIRSSAPRGVLVPLVPDKVKVCSARFVVELVKRAHPGLRLEHVAVPPPMLGPRLGTEYFSIERTGPCWDTIADTAEVGVYVPGAIPDPELELVVIPET